MYWFWRVIIDTVLVWLIGYVAYAFVWDVIYSVNGNTNWPADDNLVNLIWSLTLGCVALFAVLVHAFLTYALGSRSRTDSEIRCRKCG